MRPPLPDLSRVSVVGTTGSGKTTFAHRLAALLDAPLVELDAMYGGPEWTPVEEGIFCREVAAHAARERWVIDGNYAVVRDIVWQRATAILWLDYPLPLVLWRLLKRRLRHARHRRHPRRPQRGRHSLLRWAIASHRDRRRRYEEHFARGDFAQATPIVFHRPAHAASFLEQVRHAC